VVPVVGGGGPLLVFAGADLADLGIVDEVRPAELGCASCGDGNEREPERGEGVRAARTQAESGSRVLDGETASIASPSSVLIGGPASVVS
jgi:hypothetical protein